MPAQRRGPAWSREENLRTVADYFALLEAELRGAPVNKAQHNAQLRVGLNNRSKGAVERKHQNISSILRALELPSIDGYKPLGNFQNDLRDVVLEFLDSRPELLRRLRTLADAVPHRSPPRPGYEVEVEPPDLGPETEHMFDAARLRVVSPEFDFVGRDAANRRLGALGEAFVLARERDRLRRLGRNELAKQVVHVAASEGHGLGYDIRSFDPSGSVRLIEVKTTNLGLRSSFIVTRTELAVSRREAREFELHRVFQFARGPKLFVLRGALDKHVRLIPRDFVGRF